AAGAAGAAGAGTESGPPVSPVCGAGKFDTGEGGCDDCVDAPQTVPIICSDFYMPTLSSSGGPQTIYLNPSISEREPLASSIKVRFVSPDQSANYPLSYESSNRQWQLDV